MKWSQNKGLFSTVVSLNSGAVLVLFAVFLESRFGAAQGAVWLVVSIALLTIILIIFYYLFRYIAAILRDVQRKKIGEYFNALVNNINILIKLLFLPRLRFAYVVILLIALIFTHDIVSRSVIFMPILFLIIYDFIKIPKKPTTWTKEKAELVDDFVKGHKETATWTKEKAVFIDDFKKQNDQWQELKGKTVINDALGNPPPGLELHFTGGGTNTFLLNMKQYMKDGVIECDVLPSENSILNIVFRASDNEYYMARLDTRPNFYDSILLKTKGKNWKPIKESSRRTEAGAWHHMKVIFKANKIRFLIDGEVVATVKDKSLDSGQVGFFNEVNNVIVDNFAVYES
ncbi:hypothetical protein LCGC14_2899360 [marine sediment metagenome]|uniref:3-keto-alpha-glucoside-1,2-lyase/3-keto-2-hydroxy-glucal hydratase domain-containing protein n=1 Tax=marine sediment metagenome TaxID=412755 RepID=A0A0F9A2S8_9ZZZZ